MTKQILTCFILFILCISCRTTKYNNYIITINTTDSLSRVIKAESVSGILEYAITVPSSPAAPDSVMLNLNFHRFGCSLYGTTQKRPVYIDLEKTLVETDSLTYSLIQLCDNRTDSTSILKIAPYEEKQYQMLSKFSINNIFSKMDKIYPEYQNNVYKEITYKYQETDNKNKKKDRKVKLLYTEFTPNSSPLKLNFHLIYSTDSTMVSTSSIDMNFYQSALIKTTVKYSNDVNKLIKNNSVFISRVETVAGDNYTTEDLKDNALDVLRTGANIVIAPFALIYFLIAGTPD